MFLFAKAGGSDLIADFEKGFDKIQIAGDTGITSFSQLKITSGPNGVIKTVIEMGDGGQVTLTGVVATALDATDFLFPT